MAEFHVGSRNEMVLSFETIEAFMPVRNSKSFPDLYTDELSGQFLVSIESVPLQDHS